MARTCCNINGQRLGSHCFKSAITCCWAARSNVPNCCNSAITSCMAFGSGLVGAVLADACVVGAGGVGLGLDQGQDSEPGEPGEAQPVNNTPAIAMPTIITKSRYGEIPLRIRANALSRRFPQKRGRMIPETPGACKRGYGRNPAKKDALWKGYWKLEPGPADAVGRLF